jgi:ABC-2 type transport system ATP-binding protein
MSLRARGLGRRMEGRWALRGCTLDLEPGTWLGVLGPNGAGKTTLLRLLATVLAPDEGALFWRGLPVGQGAALRRCLGYLPQDFALPPLPTVGAGLAYLAALKGIPLADQARATARALAWAGAGDAGPRPPRHLSAGTLRRVGLAQAVLGDPAVLVLDEPDAGMDPAERAALADRLRALASCGRIVVTATNDPGCLEAADHLLLLEQGTAQGPFAVPEFRERASGRVWRRPGPTRARLPGQPLGPGTVPLAPTIADAYTLWRASGGG